MFFIERKKISPLRSVFSCTDPVMVGWPVESNVRAEFRDDSLAPYPLRGAGSPQPPQESQNLLAIRDLGKECVL